MPRHVKHLLVLEGGESDSREGQAGSVAGKDEPSEGQQLARTMKKEEALQYLARYFGVPAFDLMCRTIHLKAVASIPHEIADRYAMIAINRVDTRTTVVMANPNDANAIAELNRLFGEGGHTRFVSCTRDINSAITACYRKIAKLAELPNDTA